jgi:hypothetical protein
MKRCILCVLVFVATTLCTSAAEQNSVRVISILGTAFITNDGVLLFRSATPLPANAHGNITLLAASKENAEAIAVLAWSAHQGLKVWLDGAFLPYTGALPGRHKGLPEIEFVVAKVSLASNAHEQPPSNMVIHSKDLVRLNPTK